jgi:hypothetical protein
MQEMDQIEPVLKLKNAMDKGRSTKDRNYCMVCLVFYAVNDNLPDQTEPSLENLKAYLELDFIAN